MARLANNSSFFWNFRVSEAKNARGSKLVMEANWCKEENDGEAAA
jgi:hypothetical protein